MGEVLPDQLAAVLQALMDRIDKRVDTRRHLVGIGSVGLQRRVDQRIPQYPIRHHQASDECHQDTG
ncbi:hypothetical protein D9M71_595620 [compost metagenome]